MKLYRVILPVSNIESATEFYSNVFKMSGNRVSNGRHYFNCGGTILAIFDPKADGDNFIAQPNPDHLYFSVGNLDETFELVSSYHGVTVLENIDSKPWGERTFYIKDPFGNPICFVDEKTVFMGN